MNELKDKIGITQSVRGTGHLEELLTVLNRHPNAAQKLEGMKDILVCENENGIEVRVIKENGTPEAMSLMQCVTGRAKPKTMPCV